MTKPTTTGDIREKKVTKKQVQDWLFDHDKDFYYQFINKEQSTCEDISPEEYQALYAGDYQKLFKILKKKHGTKANQSTDKKIKWTKDKAKWSKMEEQMFAGMPQPLEEKTWNGTDTETHNGTLEEKCTHRWIVSKCHKCKERVTICDRIDCDQNYKSHVESHKPPEQPECTCRKLGLVLNHLPTCELNEQPEVWFSPAQMVVIADIKEQVREEAFKKGEDHAYIMVNAITKAADESSKVQWETLKKGIEKEAKQEAIKEIVKIMEEYEKLYEDNLFGTFDYEEFGKRMLELKESLSK